MSVHGPDRHLTDGTASMPPPPVTLDDLEVFADLAMTPADGYLRQCRECGSTFVTRVESLSKWGTCCGPCLRVLG